MLSLGVSYNICLVTQMLSGGFVEFLIGHTVDMEDREYHSENFLCKLVAA